MGRFSYEKRIPRVGGPGGSKGNRASPKKQFNRTCPTCGGGLPCRDSDCRKAIGQSNYNARKAAPKPKSKAKGKNKAKKKGGICSIIALLLLGGLGSVVYGGVELIKWVV